MHHFIAVYPQGAIGPDGQTGWNTARKKDPKVDDVGFVGSLLSTLQRSLCVDPQRIYATGFSNGGGITAILACEFSGRIAAFAPVAGDYYPQPGGCHPNRPVSLLEVHGVADTVNPYDGSAELRYPAVGAWLADWAQRDSCAVGPIGLEVASGVMLEKWSGCSGSAVIMHYRLAGVGHIWPGAQSNNTSGPKSAMSFDASTAIWAFFSQRALTTQRTS
jgi:polyhydroxybutyrate depolymerase